MKTMEKTWRWISFLLVITFLLNPVNFTIHAEDIDAGSSEESDTIDEEHGDIELPEIPAEPDDPEQPDEPEQPEEPEPTILIGWVLQEEEDGSFWYYYDENGQKVISQWQGSYYLKDTGRMAVSEWVDNGQYYVGPDGKYIYDRWIQDEKGWRYLYGDGTYAVDGWKDIKGERYHFGTDTYMQTGWLKSDGKWYYLRSNGKLARSQWVDQGQYYVDANGVYIPKQWKKNAKGWWYEYGDGTYPTNTWKKINGQWYYFKDSGYMATGWLQKGSTWYYLKSNGALASDCWVDNKYYINDEGKWDKDVLPPVQLIRAGASGQTHMDISWTAISGAEGYRIYRKNNFGWTQVGEVNSGATTIYTDSSCTYGTTYTYTVRAFKYSSNGKKVFGGFDQKGVTGKLAYSPHYAGGYKLYYDSDGYLIRNVDKIIGKQSSYRIVVYRESCVTTIYAKDGANGYTIPVKSCICSPGEGGNTLLGTFYTPEKFRWKELIGPVYGQWSTRIYRGILFHTVYYYTNYDNTSLCVSRFNRLGTKDSMGCVRLNCADAKWIYDNCPVGTEVTVLNSSYVSPFGKPSSPQLPSWHTWDPTDPNCRYLCEQHNCH